LINYLRQLTLLVIIDGNQRSEVLNCNFTFENAQAAKCWHANESIETRSTWPNVPDHAINRVLSWSKAL